MSVRAAEIDLQRIQLELPGTGQLLRDFSFKVDSSEFLALLGPSGSGKSTILKVIAGLMYPNSGHAEVRAFDQKFFRGFVFQEAHLLPWRTVLENAALPLELMGIESRQSHQRAREILSKVGLSNSEALYPSQLSGGMKMRVSLARALVGEPSLLLMDEPFSALDETTRHQLQEDLRSLWRNLRMTVVFVTHSISEALFLADRVVVISGRPATIQLDRRLPFPEIRDDSFRLSASLNEETRAMSEVFRRASGLGRT